MSIKNKWNASECPITTKKSDTIIRLPMFHSLKNKELDYIINKIIMYVSV